MMMILSSYEMTKKKVIRMGNDEVDDGKYLTFDEMMMLDKYLLLDGYQYCSWCLGRILGWGEF